MFAHIYRADGREENIELDYCYSDEEIAIAVCEDGTLVAAIGLLCALPDGMALSSGSSTAWFVLR